MAKRQHGYMVTVKMFVPVNPKDIKDTVSKASAIDHAGNTKSLSELAATGAQIVSLDHRYTSRATPEEAAAETEEGEAEDGAAHGVSAYMDDPEAGEAENVTESDEQAEPTAGRRRK